MPRTTIAILGLRTPLGAELASLLESDSVIWNLSEAVTASMPTRDLAQKLEGAEVIISVAGMPFYAKWTSKYEYALYANRMRCIRCLTEAVYYMRHKPKVFVTLSNAMLYDRYEVHDDFSCVYDDGFMAEVAQMETNETLAMRKQVADCRLLIIRAGYIMAPDSLGYRILRRASMLGLAGIVDDGYQCMPLVWQTDLCRAIAYLVRRPDLQGVFNVTLPQMASMKELVGAIKKHTGRRQHALPKAALKLVAGRAVAMLEHNCKVLPQRLLDAGFEFQCPDVDTLWARLSGKRAAV